MRALIWGFRTVAATAALVLVAPAQAQPGPDPLAPEVRQQGDATYRAACAACHDNAGSHAPSVAALSSLSPERILRALTTGRMQQQAASLSEQQRAAVAQVLANRPMGATGNEPELVRCTGQAAQFDRASPPPYAGWGLDARNSHAMTSEQAGLDRDSVGRLALRWAFAVPETVDMRSQPAIAGGAIYLGGGNGTVYALDLASGCVRWTYEAASGVRTGMVVSPWTADDADARPLVFFGDNLARAYAIDAATGEEVWSRRVDSHGMALLTGTPTLHGDTLFVPVSSSEEGSAALPSYECCTFRGSLLALDAATGAERWRTWMVDPSQQTGTNAAGTRQFGPSGVAIWSAPLVDEGRGLVYVTTGDNYTHPATHLSDAVVALDIATGEERWATQVTPGDAWNVGCWGGANGPNCPEDAGPDADFGAPAIMAQGTDGRDYLLAGQKSGVAYGLDPDTGQLLWQIRVGRGGVLGGIHFGMAAGDGRLYVPVNDDAADGPDAGPGHPGVYALDVASGALLWSAPAVDVCNGRAMCQAGYTAAISATPELVLAGSADGHMRAFDAATGAVLWDEDTARPFATLNGATGQGGSMSGGAGPLAYDGYLVVSSGYAFLGKMPGNVLLVYGPQ